MNNLKTMCVDKRSILIASIIGDGEITKIYPRSRRINNSYREHFSVKQLEYRIWKTKQLPEYFYLTKKSMCLRSKSIQLFTTLFPFFYGDDGEKHIPIDLLMFCSSFYFLLVLYLDDGSLILSKRINDKSKKIYLMPAISFYLQCYKKEELELLRQFISEQFKFELKLNKRKDGKGYILKMTKTKDVYNFLNEIKSKISNCDSMRYKFDWQYRFNVEKEKLQFDYPDYTVIESDSKRFSKYTEKEEIDIVRLKLEGKTDKAIAEYLNRTYWSVVYKIRELRKRGCFHNSLS
ncbi:DNA endonuclease [Metabacillus niabensis]|uniref:DNA endonuclease n=1 Tax=Metabacillus niabensis TaxID=324854 RepID=UPI001CFA3C6B|nr:DNA endonuclease [Metabacillus niabensis]